jgi:hypothetical protein
MDYGRKGESLWSEWSGVGYQSQLPSTIIYVTEAHVDISNDVVLRALASAVQRDGVADSLGDAFRIIKPFSTVVGYSGDVNGVEVSVCDENGETYYGDTVETIIPTTWVEVENFG